MEPPLIEFAANRACCCSDSSSSKQLLVNGGFEAFQLHPYAVPQDPNPPETRYYQDLTDNSVPGWSVTSPGRARDPGLFIQNNGALQDYNLDLANCFNSPVGNQFVRLFPGGALSQTIELEMNTLYTFSFLQSGYFNDPETAFAQAGANVGVTLTGPDNSVTFPAYTIDPQSATGLPPIWRWVPAKSFQVAITGSYVLTFTCDSTPFDGNVPAAAFIDAVCLTESVAS